MSERIIEIQPYRTYNNIVILGAKARFEEAALEIPIPVNRNLNLFNYELADHRILNPRDFENFELLVSLHWGQGIQLSQLAGLLASGENPTEVLSFRLQVSCPKTRWCSEQKRIELGNLTKKGQYSFDVPLAEVKGQIRIDGFIVRDSTLKTIATDLPEAPLAIVSTCKELTIQIDELKEIGGEHLPITPGNTGELAFDYNGFDNPFELPRIVYSEELKEFLTRDDLASVNSSMLGSLFHFLDRYLKWLLFTCRFDENDKYHKSLINLFARYCDVDDDFLMNLLEGEKYNEEYISEYLKLSDSLFRNLQIQNKYKRELKNLFKSEKR